MEPVLARKMWRTLEPIHGMIYFTPEALAAYQALGLHDIPAGYFCSRSAPMGAVTGEVVIATFFNFNPALVRSVVPGCWEKVSPAGVLDARLAAVDAALHRMLGADIESPAMEEAAALAQTAATAPGLQLAGRPLFAGHASLPWPEAPHLVLWHAISILREYRGDGHVAALTAAGLSGIEALVIHAATGEVPRASLQSSRSWDDASWDAAAAALQDRGWLDGEGSFTAAGKAHRDGVEETTDALAMAPWEHLGVERSDRLRELARPFSKAIISSGTLPAPR